MVANFQQSHQLVFNKHEWLQFGLFTAEEVDNAESSGFIGYKMGYACYVSTFINSQNIK